MIASGAQRFSEISSKTGLDRAHLTGYLASLSELGLVTREVPVTEDHPEKSRRGRYILNDPFVRFWYRFVYPNFSRLEAGDVEGVLCQVIEPQLRDYTSLHVEMPLTSMCQRGLLRGSIPFEPAYVGRHWSAQEEFDVVAIDHQRTKAFVAEVKWSERPVSSGLLEALRQRIATCEALRGLEVTPAVISRSGFRDHPKAGDLLIDLSTL